MKLQLYTSQDHAEMPRQPRGVDIEGAGAGAAAAARGFGAVASEAGQWGQLQAHLVQKEREAAAYVDSVKAQTDWASELADEDLRLKNSPDYDYKTHHEKLKEAGTGLIEKYAEKLDPEAARKFRVAVMKDLSHQVIKTKYEARTRLGSEMDAANVVENRQAEIKAVDADAATRQKILQEQANNNKALADRGWITPEQAGERTRAIYENVQTAEVRSLLRDPEADPIKVIQRLQSPEYYKDIRQTRRESLIKEATTVISAREVAMRKADAERERQAKIEGHVFMAGVAREADPTSSGPRMSDADFEAGMFKLAGVPGIGFDTIMAVRAAHARPAIQNGVSTPGAFEHWKTRILTNDPSATAASIVADIGHGRNLSGHDGNELLQMLRREQVEKGVTSTEEFKIGKEQIAVLVGRINPASPLVGPLGGFMNRAQADKYAAALSRYYDEARTIYEGRDKKGRQIYQLKDIAIGIAKQYLSDDTTTGSTGSSGGTGSMGLPTGAPREGRGSASKQTK